MNVLLTWILCRFCRLVSWWFLGFLIGLVMFALGYLVCCQLFRLFFMVYVWVLWGQVIIIGICILSLFFVCVISSFDLICVLWIDHWFWRVTLNWLCVIWRVCLICVLS